MGQEVCQTLLMSSLVLYAKRFGSWGRESGGAPMAGEPSGGSSLETGRLPPAAVAALGESVLSHALQRRQADAYGRRPGVPIAAFQDSI